MYKKLLFILIFGLVIITLIIGGTFFYSNIINQPKQQLPDLNDFTQVDDIDNLKKNGKETNEITKLKLINTIKLTDKEVGKSARPEIISDGNNFYVIYLGDITGERKFKVRIYNNDFDFLKEVVLVSSSERYGNPTDIRISSHKGYVYAFYELTDKVKGSSIFGAKYKLDENFTKVSVNNGSIVMSQYDFFNTPDGEPTLSDPASVIIDDKIYVMLKIRDKEKGINNADTLYYLIELDSNFKLVSTNKIDLSDVMDGWASANSLIYDNNEILHIQPSFSGKTDLKMIKFDKAWQYDPVNVYNLTQTKQISETMPMGALINNNLLFVTYKVGEATKITADNPLNSGDIWLEIFDQEYKSIDKIKVNDSNILGEHSTVEVVDDYVYVAYDGKSSTESKGNIYVNIYKYK